MNILNFHFFSGIPTIFLHFESPLGYFVVLKKWLMGGSTEEVREFTTDVSTRELK